MNPDSTLFDGKVILLDAMVVINYHFVLALDKLLDWAKGELAGKGTRRKKIKSPKRLIQNLSILFMRDGSKGMSSWLPQD